MRLTGRYNPRTDQLTATFRSNTSTYIDPSAVDVTAVATHHRGRRDLFEDYFLKLQSPSIEWQKVLGSSKIGASFGLTIRNALDVKIGEHAHLRVKLKVEPKGKRFPATQKPR